MKSTTRLSFVITTCAFAAIGCEASSSDKPPTPIAVASVTENDATHEASDSRSQAEVEGKVSATTKPEESTEKTEGVSSVQPVPSTSIEAIALVNLLELPRLNEKNAQKLEVGVTQFDYKGTGTLTEGDTFYKKLLASRGWKEIPPLTPPTDQYVDRLFEKMGYYLRVTMYTGSEHGELNIMLANLGNVDVRSLPKLPDAYDDPASSTPVIASYNSGSSIPSAADALLKTFSASGWQLCNDYQKASIDVPHFRDMHFRKEACRLHVGVVKHPQDSAEKTIVFYHAEPVTPFDIPTIDSTQELKLDMTSRRASFVASNSRKDLVSLLRANSQKFGWEIGQTDKFEAGEEHLVPIHVNSGAYVVARLVESGGKYYGSLESFASSPKKKEPEAEVVARNENATRNEESPPSKDTSFDDLRAQIDSSVQAEISKAIGSINSPASGPKDLAELQAMAKELTSKFGAMESKESDEQSGNQLTQANPFEIPEDATAPPADIRSINKAICTLKHADKSYELRYSACYVVKHLDDPTKCVIFSDSPIDVELLRRELKEEGTSVFRSYHSKNATNIMCFSIKEYGVTFDAILGKQSMGVSTDKVKSSVSYYQGKIAGRIMTTDPIEVGETTIEFTAELNQPVLQIDWAKRK